MVLSSTFSINFSPTHSTWNSLRGSQPIQISAPNLCGGTALKSHCVSFNPSQPTESILNTGPFSRMRFFVRRLALFVGLIIIVSIFFILTFFQFLTNSRTFSTDSFQRCTRFFTLRCSSLFCSSVIVIIYHTISRLSRGYLKKLFTIFGGAPHLACQLV